jgi:hypothetical protein
VRFPPPTLPLVMCKSREQAEAALARLRELLADLGLEPKEAKTRIVCVPRAQRERLECRQETSIDVLLRGR